MLSLCFQTACRVGVLLGAVVVANAGLAQSKEIYETKFDQIWTTLRDQFYDPQMHGVDWNDAGRRHRDVAAAATSRQEFQKSINAMLAELKASHLYYYTLDDFDYYFMRQVFLPDSPAIKISHIGVMGRPGTEGFRVQAAMENGPAAKAGIQVDDLLLLPDASQPFTSVGSVRDLPSPLPLHVKRDNQLLKLEVTPVEQTAVEAFADATKSSARIIEKDDKRIGYIHLWCMTHREVQRQFEYAIRDPLRNTDGLIVDLRDGYGGAVWQFDYVFFQPTLAMQVLPRNGESFIEHHGYHQPLVALINGGSRSAKECFAFELKKTGRARLVATTTAGYFLGAGGFEIGDDGLLMVPVSDLRLDGQRLEGVGVSPHIEIQPHASYTENDAQIAGAVDEALKLIRGRL